MHKITQVSLSLITILGILGIGNEKRYVDIHDYARRPVATLDTKNCEVRVSNGYLERIKRPHLFGVWMTTSDTLSLVDSIETLDDREIDYLWRHITKLYLEDVFKSCK